MDDRIQWALDGELHRDQLTAAEQAALREAEMQIDAVRRAIPHPEVPDLAPVVLDRVNASSARKPIRASGVPRALRWRDRLSRAPGFGLRPAWGLAAAALFVLAFALGRATTPSAPGRQPVLTQFMLVAPDAQQVALAGDFTEWAPSHPMTRSGPGVWTVVVPLEPGIHNYAFVVDGEQWTPDPNAPAVDDGFGGLNSRLAVLAPDDLEP
jgi:hypothetical protein